ncbi:DUF7286 family protein [Halovenus halobia]|uniref:DUF7286 family protein n=1 Tax=Halovenus halobia TaxID=3396622 RepID=UPI003F57DE2B
MTGRSSLLRDRRARIPFALLGLALVLLSVTFVVQVETADQPDPRQETDRAMEQTAAATETALTDALRAASRQAGTAPVTEAADTPYGEVLDDGTTFEQYLKALFYLEAQDQLSGAGQTVGSVETEVSLPAVEDRADFAAALDRVTVRPGSEIEGIETGIIEAEISGIQTVARADGTRRAAETKTVTVAVASPLFQLHDRTERFEQRLDAPINKPGFAQRFNARIYALGWARGYAQYGGLPVTEVVANRHVVPSANDAVYRTQKDVFGAADPQLSNAVRRGWLCMAMHDAEGLYNNYGRSTATTGVAKEVCDASRWLFGKQATGDVPEAPGVQDLLGEAPGMDAKHTIGVNKTSLLPIRDLATGAGSNSLSAVITRIYEVRVGTAVETDVVGEPVFNHGRPSEAYRSRVIETAVEETDVSVEQVTEPDAGEQYRAIEGTVSIRLVQTKEHYQIIEGERESTETTAEGTRRVEFTLTVQERRRNPNASIDDYNHAGPDGLPIDEEFVYSSGPGVGKAATDRTIPLGTDGGKFPNYGDPGDNALFALFKGVSDQSDEDSLDGEKERSGTMAGRVEETLEEQWDGAATEDDLQFSNTATVSVPLQSRNALRAAIIYDLRQIQREVATVTHTFKRSEIIHEGSDTGPYGELREKVREHKARYLDREQPFVSVGQKVIYEARYAYFDALEGYLERIESAHGDAMSKIDSELPDTGIENAMKFLQQGLTATPPEPVPLDSSSLTDDVRYEVSGSPTYLVTEGVTSETVPAVEDGETFAPMAVKNRNFFKLPYKSIVNGLLNKIGNHFGLSDPDAELTFQSASEALVAGSESVEAAEADPDHGDPEALRELNRKVRDAVDDSIEKYTTRVSAQIAYRLYPDDVTVTAASKIISELDGCDSSECLDIPKDCTEVGCRMKDDSRGKAAYDAVTTKLTEAIEEYGSTAKTAEAIANGNISDPIVRELAHLDKRPSYAEGMGTTEWRTVVRAGTRRVVRDVAGEQGVTMSDTGTIEQLDKKIRTTLESVSREILKKRFDAAIGNGSFNLNNYDNWVNGTRTPVRVPAGMPVLPVPGQWYATVNVWTIDVHGEYARFEVSANMGTPETATATTYVREDRDVELQIAGESRDVGSVDEVDFEEKSVLIVAVPPGGIGVGDRDGKGPECSPTYPETGDVSAKSGECGRTTGAPAVSVSQGGKP